MSFKENRDAISIVNRALSKVGHAGITGDLDSAPGEPGRQARLHYKPVVRMLLSKHHWNLATKRAALVGTVNNRAGEWPFAYASPANMAFPVGVNLTAAQTSVVSYYVGVRGLVARLYGRPLFAYSGGFIYSIVSDAELEFVSYDITENDFTDDFEEMVVAFLASRFAYALPKDAKLGATLEREAIDKLNGVIANNLNEQGNRYGDTPSEAELARAGVDPTLAGLTQLY